MKRILAVTLSSSMLLSLAACSASDSSKDSLKKSYFGQIWSAPSTIKIEQNDTEYAGK